jgi:hypothetical protein
MRFEVVVLPHGEMTNETFRSHNMVQKKVMALEERVLHIRHRPILQLMQHPRRNGLLGVREILIGHTGISPTTLRGHVRHGKVGQSGIFSLRRHISNTRQCGIQNRFQTIENVLVTNQQNAIALDKVFHQVGKIET